MEILLKLNQYDGSTVELWAPRSYGYQSRTLYCVSALESFRDANFFKELAKGETVICTIEKKED